MTKDAEKVLLELYRAYSARRESMDRSRARNFSSDETAEALGGVIGMDAHDAMRELQAGGFLELYFLDGCCLSAAAIEYGETAVERKVEKALDVWSKIH